MSYLYKEQSRHSIKKTLRLNFSVKLLHSEALLQVQMCLLDRRGTQDSSSTIVFSPPLWHEFVDKVANFHFYQPKT